MLCKGKNRKKKKYIDNQKQQRRISTRWAGLQQVHGGTWLNVWFMTLHIQVCRGRWTGHIVDCGICAPWDMWRKTLGCAYILTDHHSTVQKTHWEMWYSRQNTGSV